MAATEARTPRPLVGSIVLAACALPGVLAMPAHAEEAPTEGVIAFKYSHYQDSQTGAYSGNTSSSSASAGRGFIASTARAAVAGNGIATISGASSGGGGSGGGSGTNYERDRVTVSTPSMYLLLPINRHWAAEGSLTVDDVSGASPQYYSDMRSASHFSDKRKAGDAKLSYYGERQSYALGLAHSTESDFFSDALSAEARWASADQNTTWNLGLGLTQDRIDPTNHVVSNEHRHTTELQFGVTQALSKIDLLQATLTASRARGYMNDPYKYLDARPRERNADILQLRWNHWLGDSALKSGYRYYSDSYGIRAHTFDVALAVPLWRTLTLTPGLRYYSQNAASFYTPPNAATYPNPAGSPTFFSADQRLSAFGAWALNTKVAMQLAPTWTLDGKVEFYRQRSSWQLGSHSDSSSINPLNATTWQVGLSHGF